MQENLEGYVVDIACLRKYPREELVSRAREHTRTCALMGHCIESGYALVNTVGEVVILDSGATPHVVEAVKSAPGEKGIRLRARRELRKGEMKTEEVSVFP